MAEAGATPIAQLLGTPPERLQAPLPASVQGWVRTRRDGKGVCFLEVNDGSSLASLQVLVEPGSPGYEEARALTTGSSVQVEGLLVASPAKGQAVELRATRLTVPGAAGADFPLQKKRHGFEYLRTIAHLRVRSNTFGAVARIRNALFFAVHDFFQREGFLFLPAPIITASDAEGAGEMFRVTTLDLRQVPLAQGEPDWSRDFFGRRAGLTVSGQLEAEVFALAFVKVYTFGPTFRAENSNTSRHAAEFWMIEPEIAFADLAANRDLAERFIKAILRAALERCPEDFAFCDERLEPGLLAKLQHVLESPFETLRYDEAIRLLEASGERFEFPVAWGRDLQSEHERWLAEKKVGRPLFVIDYPKQIKAFYMRQNDDGRTVAAMDLLVPGVGEIIGGSQREERLGPLQARMRELGLSLEDY
ncbi:MAG TPA: asparagine--tRNA ligase, partial [bacterium]|nr:asparagine--tRNA ligase [bacterium]